MKSRRDPFSIKPGARPRYLPHLVRVLNVRSEFFSGTALFERREGVWSCTQTTPAVEWIRKTPVPQLKLELLRRGFDWEWKE